MAVYRCLVVRGSGLGLVQVCRSGGVVCCRSGSLGVLWYGLVVVYLVQDMKRRDTKMPRLPFAYSHYSLLLH